MTSTTPARTPERAFDREHRTITLGLLALVTMFAFEAVAVSLAMPSVAHELDGETLYPIAVVGLLTAAIVGMVVGGTWSDARGPGLPLTVGGFGFVAGLLVSGLRRLDGDLRRRTPAAGTRLRSGPDGDVRRRRRRLPRRPADPGVLAVRHRLGGAVDRRAVRRRRTGRPVRLALGVPRGGGVRRAEHAPRPRRDGPAPGRARVAAGVGPAAGLRRGRGGGRARAAPGRPRHRPAHGPPPRRRAGAAGVRDGTAAAARHGAGGPRPPGGGGRARRLRWRLRLRRDVPAARAPGRERAQPHHDRAGDDGRCARLDRRLGVRREARSPRDLRGAAARRRRGPARWCGDHARPRADRPPARRGARSSPRSGSP